MILGKVVLKAGLFAKNSQNRIKQVGYKEGGEVVTNVDKECELLIRKELKRYYPDYNFFGEELGFEDNNSDFTFYIDPIDGTNQFIKKSGHYAVIIGLVEGKNPVQSVVYLPAKNELYSAERGKGAWLNGKRIKVSRSLLVNKERVYSSKGFIPNTTPIKSIGYESALLACGKINGVIQKYVKGKKPLEMPAVVLLVREAGGEVTNFKGGEWKLSDKKIILSNKKTHKQLLSKI